MLGHKSRAIWTLLLAGAVSGRLWLFVAELKFMYGSYLPTRVVPFSFVVFNLLPLLADAVTCAGVGLLFLAQRQGGGRLGWRWWAGGLLALPSAWSTIGEVLAELSTAAENLPPGQPFASVGLLLLAALALWRLAEPAPREG